MVWPAGTIVAYAEPCTTSWSVMPARCNAVPIPRTWSFPSAQSTPTGRYLGCVHLQRLLREPPFELVAGAIDSEMARLSPDAGLPEVTRFFATYNLVCAPVVDDEDHLLGAVTVDDVLDHLLPENWRESGLADMAESGAHHGGRHG